MIDTSISIQQIMTQEVTFVTTDTFMNEVIDIFRENDFHHLPVLEDGKVVGIISVEDIHKVEHYFTIYNLPESRAFNEDFLRSVPAGDVMTKQVSTLRAQTPISVAVGFFLENLFHAIPIVDHQKCLVGILTTFDLLKYAYSDTQRLGVGNAY